MLLRVQVKRVQQKIVKLKLKVAQVRAYTYILGAKNMNKINDI